MDVNVDNRVEPVASTASKRRACDECRTRKLACTKEPDGCSRCVKEGIQCHYSEQKPMGRPRKRQRSDGGQHEHSYPTPPEADNPKVIDPNLQGLPDLSNDGGQRSAIYMSSVTDSTDNSTIMPDGREVFHFGSARIYPSDIDFDTADNTAAQLDNETVSPDLMTANPFGEFSATDLSNLSGGLSFASPRPKGPPCSCLAAIYLSMAALQELPEDVEQALSTVRNAAKTAQNTIRCPVCGVCLVRDPSPPVAGFQNIMLLGTILPLIVYGYKRLLDIVDEETARAALAGQKKRFELEEYGGLFAVGDQPNNGDDLTGGELSPGQWRTYVRALLRVDLYGHDSSIFGMNGCSNGLRGIITELEERQKSRHQQMDALREAGLWQPHGGHEAEPPEHKDKMCLSMVDTARRALDSLVIP